MKLLTGYVVVYICSWQDLWGLKSYKTMHNRKLCIFDKISYNNNEHFIIFEELRVARLTLLYAIYQTRSHKISGFGPLF